MNEVDRIHQDDGTETCNKPILSEVTASKLIVLGCWYTGKKA
jgi:hypothetical protein